MIVWSIVVTLYALVTVFAIYMTYQEQKRRDQPSAMYNLIGYLACTIWPLAVAAVFVVARLRPASFSAAERD